MSYILAANRYAIKGSPNQKLLLEDIYYAIESRVRVLSRLSIAICSHSFMNSFRTSELRRQDGRCVRVCLVCGRTSHCRYQPEFRPP